MYTITIKKTSVKMQPESQEYQADARPADKDGNTYGYVTKPPCEKEVTETVFEQKVDDINLLDVVAAVNGVDFK